MRPYESRVEFSGRTGGLFMDVDLDNIAVEFEPAVTTLPFEDFDVSQYRSVLRPGANVLADPGLERPTGRRRHADRARADGDRELADSGAGGNLFRHADARRRELDRRRCAGRTAGVLAGQRHVRRAVLLDAVGRFAAGDDSLHDGRLDPDRDVDGVLDARCRSARRRGFAPACSRTALLPVRWSATATWAWTARWPVSIPICP